MRGPSLLLLASALLLWSVPAVAQTTGSVLGTVHDAETGEPVVAANVEVSGHSIRTLTDNDGRFILASIPPGERDLRISLIGYRMLTVEAVPVRPGRSIELSLVLNPSALRLEGLTVEAERVRLIEPEVSVTHEVIGGRELRELPVDGIAEAIDLTPGVSDGHFRGGRVGQEVYVIDGLSLKNQLEGSTHGLGLELSPTSLEEIDVMTGGFGSEYGSALAGVVSFATRRGSREAWELRGSGQSDQWAPGSLYTGFTGVSLSAGGPVSFLGGESTLFADLLVQGMLDADPRARGLTCLEPTDADDGLAERLKELRSDPEFGALSCPSPHDVLPHQRGDKLIGFLRYDRSLGAGTTMTASLLRNRLQSELYTPDFKYHRESQLGQRTTGTLLNLALDWTRHTSGRAYNFTIRGAGLRLDRHLGVVDPETFANRTMVANFGLEDFRFLGEDWVRGPVQEQIESGEAVPGYRIPTSSVGTPFGPAAEGIFSTDGTPGIANWSRSEFVGGDATGEVLTVEGTSFRAGTSARVYRIESYERIQAYLPGSAPNYARFYPATVGTFVDARIMAAELFRVRFGARIDAFRSGIDFPLDRNDYLAPVLDPGWQVTFMPRVGFAGPIPGSDRRVGFKLNYGRIAQPPDFRYFLDTAIGDSLRTDIRRQGNPELSFEGGRSYEIGLNYLATPNLGITFTAFRKELADLVSGAIWAIGREQGQFNTADHGRVQGAEVSVRGMWRDLRLRGGYALQKAVGIASTAIGDTGDLPSQLQEVPLAFDRRHALDIALYYGRPAGDDDSPWSVALTSTIHSGYPVNRRRLANDQIDLETEYMPWTREVDLRVGRRLGGLPGCGRCAWRIFADGRNILGTENIRALRRDSGRLAPPEEVIDAEMAGIPPFFPDIPRESPRYSPAIDMDDDGLITSEEFQTARFAAAVDRFDPSLFYGEARQLRIGLEVAF